MRDLVAARVGPGDVLLIHSALSSAGNVQGGARTVIESFMDAVTPEGTLLMPTFGHADIVLRDFAHGQIVDLRTARSETGAITEAFRNWRGVRRSSHPFSSFCAWGKHAEYAVADHAAAPEIAHARSPMGRLLELDGKIVGIGVTLAAASFNHVVEDTLSDFPIAVYLEPETISYIDSGGSTVTRQIRRYDREVSRTRIDQPTSRWVRERMTQHLEGRGILQPFRYGEAKSWIARARPYYEELKDLASNGITIYLTEDEWKRGGDVSRPW